MADIWLLVITALIAGALAFILILILRLQRSLAGKQNVFSNAFEKTTGQEQELSLEDELAVFNTPLMTSAIDRLTFEESLKPDKFAVACHDCAVTQLAGTLGIQASDASLIAANGFQMLPSGARMLVEPTPQVRAMIKSGSLKILEGKQGSRLPVVVNRSTGKFAGQMREATSAARVAKLTALSSAVIGAAHMLSGADISKRLKVVDRKLDLLIACRQIDQLGRLESIYYSARELGHGTLTEAKRWEIWRLRRDLRDLRCSWRRELDFHLHTIEDRQAKSFFQRLFSRQITSDRDVTTKITEGELQIALIEYAMRLDHVLAIGSDMVSEYEHTLSGELAEVRQVAHLLGEKAKLIKGTGEEFDVKPTIDGLNEIVTAYARLLPEVLPENPDSKSID